MNLRHPALALQMLLALALVAISAGRQPQPDVQVKDGVSGIQFWQEDPPSSSQRILDFRIAGMYEWKNKSAPVLRVKGEQVVAGNFSLFVLNNGKEMQTMRNPNEKDRMSIRLPHDLLEYASLYVIYKSELLNNETRTCNFPMAVSKQLCNLTNSNYYLAVVVSERIHLHSCQQSSTLMKPPGKFTCNLAYDEELPPKSPSELLISCAITSTSSRPWWMAQTDVSFVFEMIELHAAAGVNQWTRNFQVSVEKSICIDVKQGASFIKKSFYCGAPGKWILVQATASNVRLTICGLVAHGSPGGCPEILDQDSDATKCERTLPSHIGMGTKPYPGSLNCQWTLSPRHGTDTFFLQFPVFSTAGPEDYVAVFEGVGIGGRLLAKFYGPAGGSNAPEYKKPDIFGAKHFLRPGNISNAVTVQFVTAPSNRWTKVWRTSNSHKGFVLKYTIVRNDDFSENGKTSEFNTPYRICTITRYTERLHLLCLKRGGINPISLYGNVTGGQILLKMDPSNATQLEINIPLMEEKLGHVPFRIPEIEEDMEDHTVQSDCRTYKKPEVPPRYFNECCCSYCSPRYLTRYCLWTYGTADSCRLNTKRIGSQVVKPRY